MGIDWEEILGVEGEDLADAYEDSIPDDDDDNPRSYRSYSPRSYDYSDEYEFFDDEDFFDDDLPEGEDFPDEEEVFPDEEGVFPYVGEECSPGEEEDSSGAAKCSPGKEKIEEPEEADPAEYDLDEDELLFS